MLPVARLYPVFYRTPSILAGRIRDARSRKIPSPCMRENRLFSCIGKQIFFATYPEALNISSDVRFSRTNFLLDVAHSYVLTRFAMSKQI